MNVKKVLKYILLIFIFLFIGAGGAALPLMFTLTCSGMALPTSCTLLAASGLEKLTSKGPGRTGGVVGVSSSLAPPHPAKRALSVRTDKAIGSWE